MVELSSAQDEKRDTVYESASPREDLSTSLPTQSPSEICVSAVRKSELDRVDGTLSSLVTVYKNQSLV